MGRKEQVVEELQKQVKDPTHIRNIGIVAHIDHGKTTLSDSLLAGAGLMSEELAGKQCVTDAYYLEQQRGITIFAGAASMVYDFEGKKYVVNLSDTPGHVDFGAEVIRSMRAVDGAVVLACAVEGIMPQTETVLRQALEERVRPVLFINKVDRLVNELKLNPEEIQLRFVKIISGVNKLIKNMAPDEFKEAWLVNVNDGSVAFGSGYHGWALNVPYMKQAGFTLKDVIDIYQKHKNDPETAGKEIHKRAPACNVLLDMVVKHLPDPLTAQKYRIPKIWAGDKESPAGKALINCDPNGPLAFMVTKMVVDPQAGDIATGRLFSGTLKPGMDVYLTGGKCTARVQQVSVTFGKSAYADRFSIPEATAGSIIAVSGLKAAISGETVCSEDIHIEPFETIHLSEPVITKAVEASNTKDLPKLIEVLRDIAKEDPSVKVEIDEETGEHKMSGMGELHLEIVEHRIRVDRGVPIKTSQPIVVYRETVGAKSPEVEGKSPNKHNKFYITVEPLDPAIVQAFADGTINPEKHKGKALMDILVTLGMDKKEAKGVKAINGHNIFFDASKGVQWLNEAMDLCIEAFEEATDKGPLCREKCARVRVNLTDASLHEDTIHRGPGQVIPAVRAGIHEAMLRASASLIEPKQKVYIRVPQDYMGAVTRELQGRRGQILDMQQEGDLMIIEAKAPVAEMLGFASAIRSAAEGRVLWSTENAGFELLPRELQDTIVRRIRDRKGLGG